MIELVAFSNNHPYQQEEDDLENPVDRKINLEHSQYPGQDLFPDSVCEQPLALDCHAPDLLGKPLNTLIIF
jgi:hypothetical protein